MGDLFDGFRVGVLLSGWVCFSQVGMLNRGWVHLSADGCAFGWVHIYKRITTYYTTL